MWDVCPLNNAMCSVSARSPCCGAEKLKVQLQARCSAKQAVWPSRFLPGRKDLSSSASQAPTRPGAGSLGTSEARQQMRGLPLARATLAMPPREQNESGESRQAEGIPSVEEPSAFYRALLNKHLAAPAAEGSGAVGSDLVDVSCDRRHDVPTLVLMRHGESMWNDLKLFTGDVDIPLTEKGVMEALAGGRSVAEIDFSVIFTSRLMRSKQTALMAMTQNAHKGVPVIVRGGYHGKGQTGDDNRLRLRAAAAQALKQAECRMIPVYADPALNERCYGDLQGLNKVVAEQTYGQEVVAKWRRSHDTRPPKGESLKDTFDRSLAFFMSTIDPLVGEGKNVLVVAHGNVLRCIISHLCGLKEEEMLRLQIATALPYMFQYDGEKYIQSPDGPTVDPSTGCILSGKPMGLTSAIKKGAADSLI